MPATAKDTVRAARTLYSWDFLLGVQDITRQGGAPYFLHSTSRSVAEIVASPEAGVLMDERSAGGIVRGVARLREALPSRSATRAYAEQFGWQPTTEGQLALFRRVLQADAG